MTSAEEARPARSEWPANFWPRPRSAIAAHTSGERRLLDEACHLLSAKPRPVSPSRQPVLPRNIISARLSKISIQPEESSVLARGVATVELHLSQGRDPTSSREQATGLSEVNSDVNGMDQLTQQNAYMVQQSHASSTSLADETAKLQELVARRRLPPDRR